MTNSFALWFGLCILGLLALDVLVFGTEHLLFLAKRGLDLLHWLAFWR